MCKYEMDPTSIVEDAERTRLCPQTDRRTDRRTDKVKPVYPPFNFVEAGGIIKNDFRYQSISCLFCCFVGLSLPSYLSERDCRDWVLAGEAIWTNISSARLQSKSKFYDLYLLQQGLNSLRPSDAISMD